MFGGYFLSTHSRGSPLGIQSQSMSCQDRRDWPHGGRQWHATSREGSGSLGNLVVVSFGLPKTEGAVNLVNLERTNSWPGSRFFLDFFGIFWTFPPPINWGGGWGRQLERVFDSLRKHRNVRKHHRKSKICTSCPFVLNFSGDFQSHSSIVFALSKKLWPGWEQFQPVAQEHSQQWFFRNGSATSREAAQLVGPSLYHFSKGQVCGGWKAAECEGEWVHHHEMLWLWIIA